MEIKKVKNLIGEFEQFATGNDAKPLFPDFYTQKKNISRNAYNNSERSTGLEVEMSPGEGPKVEEIRQSVPRHKKTRMNNKNGNRKFKSQMRL